LCPASGPSRESCTLNSRPGVVHNVSPAGSIAPPTHKYPGCVVGIPCVTGNCFTPLERVPSAGLLQNPSLRLREGVPVLALAGCTWGRCRYGRIHPAHAKPSCPLECGLGSRSRHALVPAWHRDLRCWLLPPASGLCPDVRIQPVDHHLEHLPLLGLVVHLVIEAGPTVIRTVSVDALGELADG
jgi:hypothetical protein